MVCRAGLAGCGAPGRWRGTPRPRPILPSQSKDRNVCRFSQKKKPRPQAPNPKPQALAPGPAPQAPRPGTRDRGPTPKAPGPGEAPGPCRRVSGPGPRAPGPGPRAPGTGHRAPRPAPRAFFTWGSEPDLFKLGFCSCLEGAWAARPRRNQQPSNLPQSHGGPREAPGRPPTTLERPPGGPGRTPEALRRRLGPSWLGLRSSWAILARVLAGLSRVGGLVGWFGVS